MDWQEESLVKVFRMMTKQELFAWWQKDFSEEELENSWAALILQEDATTDNKGPNGALRALICVEERWTKRVGHSYEPTCCSTSIASDAVHAAVGTGVASRARSLH